MSWMALAQLSCIMNWVALQKHSWTTHTTAGTAAKGTVVVAKGIAEPTYSSQTFTSTPQKHVRIYSP